MPSGHPRPPLPPGPYLVLGLARSGVAAALALRAAAPGERVVACDTGSPPEAVEAAGRLAEAGVEVRLGSDGMEPLLSSGAIRSVVKSPGVPREAAAVAAALDRGLPVVGELEIAWRLLPNRFCCVTGTNGKTTTTELAGAMFRAAGLPVAVAGNVGTAACSLAGEIEPAATVVCEVSSFQLEDSQALAPECSAFLNFTEDHLDRHGTAAAYLAAKLRAFANQGPGDFAVLNADEPVLRDPGAIPGAGERVWFGLAAAAPGGAALAARAAGGAIRWRGEPVIGLGEVRLRGAHNLANGLAATACAASLGVPLDGIAAALAGFAGVPHRLEEVVTVNGVLYVNDSKATNVASALVGLEVFDGGVHLILGGSLKGGGFAALREAVAQRCAACYLIGAAAERLEADLGGAGVPLRRSGDLERAVREARAAARPGDVVLLSPACASFDHYQDFEQRGAHFRALARGLAAEEVGQ